MFGLAGEVVSCAYQKMERKDSGYVKAGPASRYTAYGRVPKKDQMVHVTYKTPSMNYVICDQS